MTRRDEEREAAADAAYDAWRSGLNYDNAYDRATDAIERQEPIGYYECYDVGVNAAMKPIRQHHTYTEGQD